MRFSSTGLALAACALALGGCGVARTVRSTIDPVAQAADQTARVPGYRMAATMTMTVGSHPVDATLNGVFDRRNRTGTMRADETVLGHRLSITEKFSGLTFYMQASGLPGAGRLTGGKPWLKYDMSRIIGSLGMGGMPAGATDPSQFVDYLRAVSDSTEKVGTETIRGVATTRYHAVVDLDRYTKLKGAASRRTITSLEAAIGGRTFPMDAWIDARRLVRRVQFAFPECVAGQHMHLSMSMDLFGYGAQPATALPDPSQTYDLTPMMSSAMKNIKLGGCPA